MKSQRKILAGVIALIMFCFTGQAGAQLTTIGTAYYGPNAYNLIWDDDVFGNSVVWLDLSHSPASWGNQKYWAEAILSEVLILDVDESYVVNWTDPSWRLPMYSPRSRESELYHLFHEELDPADINAGVFDNLILTDYWTGAHEDEVKDPQNAYAFSIPGGDHTLLNVAQGLYALAVRNANVTHTPVPSAVWLLASGIFFLFYTRKR